MIKSDVISIPVSIDDRQSKLSAEIFCSLISVLKMCNFKNEEISDFFREVADIIEKGGTESEFSRIISEHIAGMPEFSSEDSDDYDQGSSLYEVESLFQETDTYKKLSRIEKRLHSSYDEDRLKMAQKLFPLYKELIQLQSEAKSQIKSLCDEKNIHFVESKSDWQETASDEDLDKEDEIFFFDNSIYMPRVTDWDLREVVSFLSINDDLAALQELRDAFSAEDSTENEKMASIVNEGISDIDTRKVFNEWILEFLVQNPDGYYQSKIVDEAMAKFKEIGYQQKAIDWIEALKGAEKLKVFKKSNRWWIAAS